MPVLSLVELLRWKELEGKVEEGAVEVVMGSVVVEKAGGGEAFICEIVEYSSESRSE